MRSGSHVQLAALRNRDQELQTTSPFSNHGSMERSTACFRHKNVLVLLGFQKFPFFCVTLYIKNVYSLKFRLISSCHLDTDFCSGLCLSGFLARILYTILFEEARVLLCVGSVVNKVVLGHAPHPQYFHFPLSVPFIHLLWMLIIFAIDGFIKWRACVSFSFLHLMT